MNLNKHYLLLNRSIINFIKRNITISNKQFNLTNIKRAVLYVPGNDKRKIDKAFKINADCVVIDCEDGVAVNRKKEARETINHLLNNNNNNNNNNLTVRINSVQSEFINDDLNVIFNANNKPKCLFIPKTDECDNIKWLYENINNYYLKNDDNKNNNKLNIFLYMESAISLINLKYIIETSINLSKNKYNSRYVLEGVVFGSDDYCADIGATRSNNANEVLFARQYLVTICKAYRLQAIDMVYINYNDIDGLKLQSEEGARFGFTGKQVIHPNQVLPVQNAFTPSTEKIEWASNLIKAFNEHQISGKGAFTYQGQMIDKPLLLQAQNILSIVKK